MPMSHKTHKSDLEGAGIVNQTKFGRSLIMESSKRDSIARHLNLILLLHIRRDPIHIFIPLRFIQFRMRYRFTKVRFE